MHWSFKHYDGLTRDELYEILRLRCQVFIVEQNCVYEDVDGEDRGAWHLLARDGQGKVCAGLRIIPRKGGEPAHMGASSSGRTAGAKASAATWSAAGWKQRAMCWKSVRSESRRRPTCSTFTKALASARWRRLMT